MLLLAGLMQFENFMIGTFRNGEVSIYDASGAQAKLWGGHQEGASSLCARSYFALTSITDHDMKLLLLLVHAIDCLCFEYFFSMVPPQVGFNNLKAVIFASTKPHVSYHLLTVPVVHLLASRFSQIFNRQPMGEHTSNTAVQLMMHPVANKPMLLCGQTLGPLGDRSFFEDFYNWRMEKESKP